MPRTPSSSGRVRRCRHMPEKAGGKYPFRQTNCCSRSLSLRGKPRMVSGTRSPLIRSRNWKNRSRYGRYTCDRQPFPHRRARVGGLCGFPDAAERVPAKHQKTGRCADVRECPAELQHRSRSACGRLSAEEKPRAAKQEKAKVSCAHLGRHICPQCGQFGAFAQGLLRGQKQPHWGRKRR